MAVTPGNEPLEKLPPKSGHGAGKGVMTSSDPIVEGPRCLLMHKDYVVEEVESFIKSTDIDPCAQLGREELGVSTLFDLAQVSCRPWLAFLLSFYCLLTDDYILIRPWCM